MKGNNMLKVNEATVIAALQMYFDSKFKDGEAPQVVSVKKGSGGVYSDADVFDVQLSEKEQATPAF